MLNDYNYAKRLHETVVMDSMHDSQLPWLQLQQERENCMALTEEC
jgi:hypothetical protein